MLNVFGEPGTETIAAIVSDERVLAGAALEGGHSFVTAQTIFPFEGVSLRRRLTFIGAKGPDEVDVLDLEWPEVFADLKGEAKKELLRPVLGGRVVVHLHEELVRLPKGRWDAILSQNSAGILSRRLWERWGDRPLDFFSDEGQEYWMAMQFAAVYSGSRAPRSGRMIENHTNFIRMEGGMAVHRVGCWPAHLNELSIVDDMIVRGKGHEASLFSCSMETIEHQDDLVEVVGRIRV